MRLPLAFVVGKLPVSVIDHPEAHDYVVALSTELLEAREQVRVAKAVRRLPLIRRTFAQQALSYWKIRILTRVATPKNEAELIEIAERVPAGELNRHLATRRALTEDPSKLAEEQRQAQAFRGAPKPTARLCSRFGASRESRRDHSEGRR